MNARIGLTTGKNGATTRFELTTVEGAPALSFMLVLTPRDAAHRSKENSSTFEIRNGADELLVTSRELVTFESLPVESWRIPLMVERVELGEVLSDSVAESDALDRTARQPSLTEGEVRMSETRDSIPTRRPSRLGRGMGGPVTDGPFSFTARRASQASGPATPERCEAVLWPRSASSWPTRPVPCLVAFN